MPGPIYTYEQLLRLRESPLIQKPDNLPPIEQWIGSVDSTQHGDEVVSSYPSRQSAVRGHPRTQSGTQNGKIDDNDSPAKRPSLFETRHLSRHSKDGAGEDIFLGPKISFASASAARQPFKFGAAEDRSSLQTSEDSKAKPERGSARDRGFRDREGRESNGDRLRERFERLDNGNALDSRPQGGLRKTADSYGRTNARLEDGDDIGGEEIEPKRSAVGRARLDQPWFRSGEKSDGKDADTAIDTAVEKGWRDKERRNEKDWTKVQRVEQDPQWMTETSSADMANHTQDDFQKWKERMKAGSSATDDKSALLQEDTPVSEATPTRMTPMKESTQLNDKVDDVFKLWVEPKRDDLTFDGLGSTPKANSRPKSSRFAGFFGPTQQEPPRPPPVMEVASPQLIESPVKNNSEDQEGFQRMMAMLRMGGPSGQAQPLQSSGRMPTESFHHEPQPQAQSGMWTGKENRSPEIHPISRQNTIPTNHPIPLSQPQHQSQQPQPALPAQQPQQPRSQPQLPKPAPRPEPATRDNEFLLKLMQSQFQQPRSPFSEGQIYGQSYNRKDNAEMNTLLNNYNQKPSQPPQPPPQMLPMPQVQGQAQAQKQRGPPPGFFGNERAFAANHHMEAQIMPDHMMSLSAMEDRMGGGGQRPVSHELRFHQLPNFDQPPAQNNRAQSQANDSMPPPPPGFSNMQGPAPPGFFTFPGGGGGGSNSINHPQHAGVPPNIRGPMPPPQPPGFFHNQSPANFALQQQQLQQQQQTQARRLSQMQMQMPQLPPQGYEGMGAQQSRRPPSMMMQRLPSPPGQGYAQGGYAQYLKQGGGAGAY